MAPFIPAEVDSLPWSDKVHPTRTDPAPPSLVARQQAETVTVVSEGGGGGGDIQLGGGALAGIIIGTIAGTLLILWVIRSCIALGGPGRDDPHQHYVEPKRRHHHHSHHRSPSRKSRSRRRSSDVSVPPPVVIQDHSRRSGHPGYVQYPQRGGRYQYQ